MKRSKQSSIRSGGPNNHARKGVVSTGAKRECIGHGAARRKARKTICRSKKTATTPSTIRLGQYKGLVRDTNIGNVPPLSALPYIDEASARRLQEYCAQGPIAAEARMLTTCRSLYDEVRARTMLFTNSSAEPYRSPTYYIRQYHLLTLTLALSS